MSVTLQTTHGDLKLEIFADAVPKTAENFLALCASGYYDNSPFHRIIPGFIIQSGTPGSSTSGDVAAGDGDAAKVATKKKSKKRKLEKGSSIWGEGFEDEILPHLRHSARGSVSMANAGPGTKTNNSQFFITIADPSRKDQVEAVKIGLDGKNTVFGKVISGEEVLGKMASVTVDAKYRAADESEEPKILKVVIHANPLAG